jgi:hypothetical protein
MVLLRFREEREFSGAIRRYPMGLTMSEQALPHRHARQRFEQVEVM